MPEDVVAQLRDLCQYLRLPGWAEGTPKSLEEGMDRGARAVYESRNATTTRPCECGYLTDDVNGGLSTLCCRQTSSMETCPLRGLK